VVLPVCLQLRTAELYSPVHNTDPAT